MSGECRFAGEVYAVDSQQVAASKNVNRRKIADLKHGMVSYAFTVKNGF
jgi:hypothetical protein